MDDEQRQRRFRELVIDANTLSPSGGVPKIRPLNWSASEALAHALTPRTVRDRPGTSFEAVREELERVRLRGDLPVPNPPMVAFGPMPDEVPGSGPGFVLMHPVLAEDLTESFRQAVRRADQSEPPRWTRPVIGGEEVPWPGEEYLDDGEQ